MADPNSADWKAKAGDSAAKTHYDIVKENAEKVLKEDIPWEGYQRANLITDDDLKLIKRFDKRGADQQAKLLQTEADKYAELFLQLLVKVNKDATLQYVLTLIDQIITEKPAMIQAFLSLGDRNSAFPFDPLIRLLNRANADWYMNSKASAVLSQLINKASSVPDDKVKFLSGWIKEQFNKLDDRDIGNAVSALQVLLLKSSFRPVFAADSGLGMLGSVIRGKQKNPQLVYQACNCVWLMTYSKEVHPFVLPSKIIDAVVNALRTTPKEKIIRMGLASLRNMSAVEGAVDAMIDAGVIKPLESFKQRNWGDEDLVDDLGVVYDAVQKGLAHLSSFDMYKKEVASGKLDFSSPAHRSEKFWRENVTRFEEDHFRVLLYLKELLRSSPDSSVLPVACYDVGEFARFHPRGRTIISQLGLKDPLMTLMASRDPEIKKQALLALQKVMVTNWEYIN